MVRAIFFTTVLYVISAHPHPEYPPRTPSNIPRPSAPIITGTAPFQYQYVPELLQMPNTTEIVNVHGVQQDRDGNIYIVFEPQRVTESTRTLVRFDANGRNAELLGSDNKLAFGVPHGLRISHERDRTFLYHANNNGVVFKTTLNGDIVWSNDLGKQWAGTKYDPFHPTNSVVPPRSETVFVTDGYGSSFIHQLSITTGEYTGTTFGGVGAGADQFNCPHGLNYDPRRQQLLVCDRSNNRLHFVHPNGTSALILPMKLDLAGAQPCNTDFEAEHVLVPSLDGPVGIFDRNMNVVSVLQVGQLLPDHCPHPHDAIFLHGGDIALVCWAPGFVSYWRRLQ